MREIMNKKNEILICAMEKCTGCSACANICPQNAITMSEKDGFLYPVIEASKCTNCSLCRNVCPERKPREKKCVDIMVYAAKSKSPYIRKNSSSGGIFGVLAQRVLRKDGVVVGAMFSCGKVKHVVITEEKDLHIIQGSKYVQSYISDVYRCVKKYLKENRTVLFSGTPCQITGLKSYVGENECENLLCVEVACHGVINYEILRQYIREYGFLPEKTQVLFRDKRTGWSDFSISMRCDDREVSKVFSKSEFGMLFNNNVMFRESCYRCNNKIECSNADITLGDFWGIERANRNFFDEGGVSVVFVHTKKGVRLFESVAEAVFSCPVDYDSAIEGNKYIKESIAKEFDNKKIAEVLKRRGIRYVAKKYRKSPLLKRIKRKIWGCMK